MQQFILEITNSDKSVNAMFVIATDFDFCISIEIREKIKCFVDGHSCFLCLIDIRAMFHVTMQLDVCYADSIAA